MSAASPSDDLSPSSPTAATAPVPATLAPHQTPAAQAAGALLLSRVAFGLVALVALAALLIAIALWQKLPLGVATRVGPMIVRAIP